MAMKRSRKIALIVTGVLVVVVAVSVIVHRRKAGVVKVQAGAVIRQNLTQVVTASGEVRPRQYVNINSQSFGKIVQISVEEGDSVKRGQVLLRLEAIQPAAEVEAQQALVQSSKAAIDAAEANLRTAQAELQRNRADFRRAALNWERAQGLHVDQLISQQEYDARKAEFESAKASVELAQARVSQSRAELDRSRSNLAQGRATLTRVSDVLQKTIYTSPIDGVVTNLPVNVGEQMVPGIQNSPGSFLMTVADMSEVTAEVKVDETDIVNVRLGQTAEVTIDAYPNQNFVGRVTEIGTTALVRSTGRSTAELETGTQEAKDFKVVATLEDPPEIVRPGLSTTARITTATRKNVLSIRIQALTIRRRGDIQSAERRARGEKTAEAATVAAARPSEEEKEELQGVFAIADGKAQFREVQTGITGVTDIEITDGLEEGEEIVTGSYKVLRELRHLARVRKVEKIEEGDEE
jgi:HlyD family secretion protein